MPEMTRYEHGVPSWVDMATPDIDASVEFYTKLFGWDKQDMGEESGHYTMLFKSGKQVAAIMPAQQPGPPHWTTYVNVDDVDAVTKAAEAAGGKTLMAPMDVMSAGRVAIIADTTGAVVGLWQPRDHIGAQLVNEAGALVWDELETSDLTKSKAFYGEIFGWTWGGVEEYAEAKVSDRTIAGVQPRPQGLPAEVPDFWQVYFGSPDVDTDVGKATGLGATVIVAPMDIPNTGRFAVLSDPQGAVFALFKG